MRDNTPKKGDLSKQEVYCAFLSVISRLQMLPRSVAYRLTRALASRQYSVTTSGLIAPG